MSQPTYRPTFTSPYDQHADRRGQPFSVIREIAEPDEQHHPEVLPMFEIRFDDGFELDAWPEEVLDLEGSKDYLNEWASHRDSA